MTLIPTVKCTRIQASIAFYTEVLDFELIEPMVGQLDPAFVVLKRQGALLFLSSHSGDGIVGQAIYVVVDDVEKICETFRLRGLVTPGDPLAPKEVHEGPIDQTWGAKEFYVDDPDGNTLRFTDGFH